MARPKFVPTQEQRRMVKAMSGYGIKQEAICQVLNLRSTKTLRKHFRLELALGAIEADTQIGQTFYQMAKSGECPAATIFWRKTRTRWLEIPSSETRSAAIPDFIVALEKEAA